MFQITQTDLAMLENLCSGGIEQNVELAQTSQWRIGGLAKLVLYPCSTEEVAALRTWFAERAIRPAVIGLTTNLLFSDEGLDVPCIQIGARLAKLSIQESRVQAGAGLWVPMLARKLMQANLSGGEHICGIPGTLGGLVCMNGGSQRKGIGSNIVEIESVNATGQVHLRTADECDFSYRHSIFQTNNEIITQATLSFNKSDYRAIRAVMLNILADRRHKFPRKQPNCGSVFKSNPAMYAEIGPPGAIIEKLGFKGKSLGHALVSPIHANFIVNTGLAKAIDVLRLINEIQSTVRKKTGYLMETEACFMKPDGTILPADKALVEVQ